GSVAVIAVAPLSHGSGRSLPSGQPEAGPGGAGPMIDSTNGGRRWVWGTDSPGSRCAYSGLRVRTMWLVQMTRAKTSGGTLVTPIITVALVFLLTATLARTEPLTIKIGYVGRAEKKATISLLDYPPDNDGVAGARLALEDNNTTGKFLNQQFLLEEVRVKDGTDPADIIRQLPDGGV